MTVDTAFKHQDKRLPMLEIKIWIGKAKDGTVKIMHTFYIKEVSTRAVINGNSSHSERMKVNMMINE